MALEPGKLKYFIADPDGEHVVATVRDPAIHMDADVRLSRTELEQMLAAITPRSVDEHFESAAKMLRQRGEELESERIRRSWGLDGSRPGA